MEERQNVDLVVQDPQIISAIFDSYIQDSINHGITYIPLMTQFVSWIENQYGDDIALTDNDRELTYKVMLSRVRKKIHWLNRQGLNPGAHVGLLTCNTIDAIEWFMAIPCAGFVVTLFPVTIEKSLLDRMSEKLEVKMILTPEEILQNNSVLFENSPCQVFPSSVMDEEEDNFAEVHENDPAAIFLTSGTTGSPKGAVLSHRAVMRGTYNGNLLPCKLSEFRTISILPIYHVFGALCGIMSAFYKGSSILVVSTPNEGVKKIPVFKPTFIATVPAILEVILKFGQVKGRDFLGDLKLVNIGGAGIPYFYQEMIKEQGMALGYGYGLTETSSAIIEHYHASKKGAICGGLFPEQEARLVNGELWVRGDSLMSEYYNDPEATRQAMEDGWFKTGDLFRMEEDGTLTMVGREKNVIILANGENVSPEEIETLFEASPLVKECLVSEANINGNPVVGIEIFPNEEVIQDSAEAESKIKELVSDINSKLPSFKQVMKLTIREEPFEKNASMKIKRNY